MAMNPSIDDPRHGFQNELLQGLDLAREQLSRKEAPRVALASKIVQPMRHRESAGKAAEAAPENPPRRTRHEPNSYKEADRTSARRARRAEYEDDPRDMRSKIAQMKLDKRRREREAERRDLTVSEEEEELGSPCFTSRIRQARKPKRFKLTAETPKYDGTQHPEAWLDDYLTAVKFQKGTQMTTIQYIQLQMVGAARSWLKADGEAATTVGSNSRTTSSKGYDQLANDQ